MDMAEVSGGLVVRGASALEFPAGLRLSPSRWPGGQLALSRRGPGLWSAAQTGTFSVTCLPSALGVKTHFPKFLKTSSLPKTTPGRARLCSAA